MLVLLSGELNPFKLLEPVEVSLEAVVTAFHQLYRGCGSSGIPFAPRIPAQYKWAYLFECVPHSPRLWHHHNRLGGALSCSGKKYLPGRLRFVDLI